MVASSKQRRSAPDGGHEAGPGLVGPSGPIASGRDPKGLAIHRGWAPLGGRRRWMEPFVLVLLAEGAAHGYAIVGQLKKMGLFSGDLDVAAVYRTLRDLEESAQVTSSWSTDAVGPQRRQYALTTAGYAALDEWAAVMRERTRLIAEFDARYLAAVAVRRRTAGREPRVGSQPAARAAPPSREPARGRARPSAGPSDPRRERRRKAAPRRGAP